MTINREIVNRALEKAGQEAITDKQIEDNSTVYRLIKSFYLSTILETLSTTEWTSRKKRKKLELAEEVNNTPYFYCYKLPIDISKAIEITDNAEYIIEKNFLYTNIENPILVYISNEKRDAEPTEEELTEDYPDYNDIDFDPLLSQYIETRLASKIVLKLTDNLNLYQLLYNEALLLEKKAEDASKEQARSKENGNKWWDEILGLGDLYNANN